MRETLTGIIRETLTGIIRETLTTGKRKEAKKNE